MDDLADRVRQGAELLDRVTPSWYQVDAWRAEIRARLEREVP
jgi:hypothetical protein